MSKAIVNALTLALADWLGGDRDLPITIKDAKAFAEEFIAENVELFGAPDRAMSSRAVIIEDAPLPKAAPRDPNALMPAQQAALERGIPLCPNCQQPANDHLPGCSRVGWNGWEAVDTKAVTKNKLAPVE